MILVEFPSLHPSAHREAPVQLIYLAIVDNWCLDSGEQILDDPIEHRQVS